MLEKRDVVLFGNVSVRKQRCYMFGNVSARKQRKKHITLWEYNSFTTATLVWVEVPKL